MREQLSVIRITKETKQKIENLSKIKNLKKITILEYLLKGKIDLDELK